MGYLKSLSNHGLWCVARTPVETGMDIMANNNSDTERRLWEAADEFRANSDLKSSEYAVPVLGLIFLRYADHKFTIAEKELEGKGSGRRKIGKEDYQAKGVMYVPPEARFSHLLSLPEGENIGKAINNAMKSVEANNEGPQGRPSEEVTPRSTTPFWCRC